MSLTHLLTALWFILVGITWLGWVAISSTFLGALAFVVGVLWVVEGYHPVVIGRPRS
jgi:hypothetical protein